MAELSQTRTRATIFNAHPAPAALTRLNEVRDQSTQDLIHAYYI